LITFPTSPLALQKKEKRKKKERNLRINGDSLNKFFFASSELQDGRILSLVRGDLHFLKIQIEAVKQFVRTLSCTAQNEHTAYSSPASGPEVLALRLGSLQCNITFSEGI
jgi:hypothetical protein